MYDPTFGPTAIGRQIRKSDFSSVTDLAQPHIKKSIIDKSVKIGEQGFSGLKFDVSDLAGRKIYHLPDLATELVLRKAVQNLQKISNTQQRSRIEVVRRLKLYCEDGLPFSLVKFDVRQFYESIDLDFLSELLKRRLSTSAGTRRILDSFIEQCKLNGLAGIPRGLAISAALSEFYMQDFDRRMQSSLDTHFYARYVDDIVAVLPPMDNLKSVRKKVRSMLPAGLILNDTKTQLLKLSQDAENNPKLEEQFDHLGFSFEVTKIKKTKNQPRRRSVKLDIASSKVKKRKTRLVKAFLQYLKDGQFDDLNDRVKILTCSYRFYDHRSEKTRWAGNYHTYGLIETPSQALTELDNFKKAILLSNSGRIGEPLFHKLSKHQRSELLRLSFSRAFKTKTHFEFTPDRLNHLIECWKYA